MTTKIHIVENDKGESEIVDSSRLRLANPDYKVQVVLVAMATHPYIISKRFYDDDGEPNSYDEYVKIKHSFTVITKGEFIRNDEDNSKLNACTTNGGFNQVNRLAYSYSVVVMDTPRHQVWESNLVYSEAGIKSTRFDWNMIVIARNNGPWYETVNTRERKGLLEGKKYKVIQWAYQDHSITRGHWVTRTDDFLNPKEPKFFIKVVNEDGVEHDYWNDYFLSYAEMRNVKLESIGI